MKTAISVSNDILELSEKLAKKLKVSRSKIFAMGVKKLAKEYDAVTVEEESESITARINKVCEEVDTSLDPHWKKLQARTLPKDEWK